MKKIEQLEGEEKTFLLLKMFLKKMFDFKNIIDNELYKKEFLEFSKRYSITRIEFENIFESRDFTPMFPPISQISFHLFH